MLKRFTSHTLMALAEASLIALLVVGLIAGTAFAGKGGGKGGGGTTSGASSVTHWMATGDDTTANYGERISFTVRTSSTDRPFVGLRCYQGDAFVLDGYTGYFPSYTGNPWIVLSSPYWKAEESADCTARLFYYGSRGRQVVLATENFTVHP